MKVNVEDLVAREDILSKMMTYWQIVSVLKQLQIVLERGVDGAIVELGCNIGTTSVYIRKLLDIYESDKDYHVYDSWEGLPEKHEHDQSDKSWQFYEGSCKTNGDVFRNTFRNADLVPPEIHSGWFKDIPDSEYPDKIAFAFFDGDFYTSIIDSFDKTYHKMQPGGIFMIDDCGWDVLPGAEKAAQDFLRDKPEELDLTGYPDDNGVYGGRFGGGVVVKQ